MRVLLILFVLSSWSLQTSCKSTPETRVDVDLFYEDTWTLDSVRLSMSHNESEIPIEKRISILLSDDLDGTTQRLSIDGVRLGARFAHGWVDVVPLRDKTVKATVVLAPLPCGAWCEPGATTCFGDGIAICEERDADHCMEWSDIIACGIDAPSCSLGECRTQCIDECATGETRCEGPEGVRVCGQSDSDTCLDWGEITMCPSEQICSAGQCVSTCQDACTLGDTTCLGAGVSTCGDLDANECLEWSPVVPCAGTDSCSGGLCSSVCTDDCSTSDCNGLSFSACGQFDADDCLDLSPGISCVPGDACLEGLCTTDGCVSVAKVCEQPPGDMCINATTLRSHQAAGTCSAGVCDYPFEDMTCDCENGACACSDLCMSSVVATGQHLAIRTALDASHVYWTNLGGNHIMRKPSDGGSPEVLAAGQDGAYGIAVDATHVYWTNARSKQLMKIPKAGGAAQELASVVGIPRELVIDATHVYWLASEAEGGGYKLLRTPKLGGVSQELASADFWYENNLAVDGTHVYWSSGFPLVNGQIKRVPKIGGISEILVDGVSPWAEIALDATHVYFTGNGTNLVLRSPKNGGSAELVIMGGGGAYANYIAVDGTHVYWSESVEEQYWLKRTPKSGGTPQELATEQDGAYRARGISVDSSHVYWANRGSGEDQEENTQVMRLPLCGCEN